VEQVRKGREEQAAQLNFDPKTILAGTRKRQKDSSHRLVSFASKPKKAQQFSLWRRLETLSANFVGHFVEKSNMSQNSSTKCLDKVGDEDTRTAIMRTAEENQVRLAVRHPPQ